MTSYKIWAERPSNAEVRAYLQGFFDELRAGRLEQAEAMVAHAYPDWNESIYALFQDHVLTVMTPADSTYEGGGWKTDRSWLADLTVKEGGEWMGKLGNIVWIDFEYRGESIGYVAEFMVKEGDGGFHVERQVFKMA
jgi:hypothetical protein